MKKNNIGVANLCIFDKLKKSYFNNDFINESKELTNTFLNVLKNSPLLMLEFKVFNNIENKTIENDVIGTRYIDRNLKLFETYTVDEIMIEHQKLYNFINEDVKIDKYKETLYNSISNLILESISSSTEIDVDDIHESFVIVLNHLKKDKQVVSVITENVEPVNDDIIEIAIGKFNEKYSDLNEDDRSLVKFLIGANNDQKVDKLKEYKRVLTEEVNKLDAEKYGERIEQTIERINEMKFSFDVLEDNIIKLHELKKGFI